MKITFTDFGEFIGITKIIQSNLKLSEKRRKQYEKDLQSARELLNQKIPDYVWKRLEEQGFITREPLKWLGKKSLFAYFVEQACAVFDITKINGMKNLKPNIERNLKAFEVVFQIPNLRGKIQDNEKYNPVGFDTIDKILQK